MFRRAIVAVKNGEKPPSTDTGFGPMKMKPFKVPQAPKPVRGEGREGRKRKQIDYAKMGGGEEDDDSDAELDGGSDAENQRPKKKTKKGKVITFEGFKGVDANGASLKVLRKWDVKFHVNKEAIKSKFAIPTMRNKTGEIIETTLSNAVLGARQILDIPPRPLHDPMDDHAIVLFDPTVDDVEAEREKARIQAEQAAVEEVMSSQDARNTVQEVKPVEKVEKGPHKSLALILGIKSRSEMAKVADKVPVVIDPRLTKVLRPHQVEGVKFLYRCTTGLIQEKAYGCIMADEMGLGKTLQCIALMWTLLKQSPVYRKPTIEKCIIVCPSSLVKNWANELVKWLGTAAPGTLAIDGKMTKDQNVAAVRRWSDLSGRSITQPVLIVSYETLRTLTTELGQAEVGLLLCDEGHRLKNSESMTYETLNSIKAKRRVILSGTPIQNDLTEYFSLINFANPDLLGGRLEFRKNYENDILRGRNSDASDKDMEVSNKKLKELSAVVSKFIIRRTNDLLSKYLPVKHEHVVFCKMAPFQMALYQHFINSTEIQKLLRGKGSQPLKAIGLLKKLCNHPDLLELPDALVGCEKLFPEGYRPGDHRNLYLEHSGKMMVLERFLRTIRKTSNDKVVLISNYTQTLDIFDKMCRANRWGNFRLDGTMAISKRQKMVDQFNDPEGKEFVFLLSSKAGGCGINLIGANRLILFDPDWNPASDQQALARVWRDGQKKACYVYRFISTGSIEEKILQRQSHKQSLSSCVVDEAQDAERHFSQNDLRELFKLNDKTECGMHDTYKCKRCSNGMQTKPAEALLYGDHSTWNHRGHRDLGALHDDLLRAEANYDDVSFVFQYVSH